MWDVSLVQISLRRLRLVVLRHMQRYFSYFSDGTKMCRRIEEEVESTVVLPTP